MALPTNKIIEYQLVFVIVWFAFFSKQNSLQKINYFVGNTVTVMSPEGKPIQVNAGALQAAAAQNVAGMLDII